MPHRSNDVNAVLVRAHQWRDSVNHVSTADTVLMRWRESRASAEAIIQQRADDVNAPGASIPYARHRRTHVG